MSSDTSLERKPHGSRDPISGPGDATNTHRMIHDTKPKQERPSQIKFVRPAQMSLFAKIQCWPPLGRITVLERPVERGGQAEYGNDAMRFTVLLESSRSFPEKEWDVAVWHNIRGEWEELSLRREQPGLAPLEVNHSPSKGKYHRYTFAGELDYPENAKHAAFTVKYRVDRSAPWQWVNEQFGTRDGELTIQGSEEPDLVKLGAREQLDQFVRNLNPKLQVEHRQSESPGATVWSVSGPVGAASDGKSAIEHTPLGSPADFTRNFALVRIWQPWLAPRHGVDTFSLTEDALLLSFLRKDGRNVVLLAISGVDSVLTTFQSRENNEVVISAKNDGSQDSKFEILIAVSSSFEIANAALMYEARKIMRKFLSSSYKGHDAQDTPESLVVSENGAETQAHFHWYDELGYCTWNALGQDLTEEKILDALDTLRSNGIKIGSLIIDDNWQALDNKGRSQFQRGWLDFEANKDGFPRGLKHAVDKVREKDPNIKHIAVWHALLGYWGGISPDGGIARRYKTKRVKKVDGVAGGTMTAVDPDDIHRFYDDLYSFLGSCGIDSVKADAQFFLDLLEDPADRDRFTKAYQDAWSISSLRYFQEKTISCMSLSPQIIFHSQVPTDKPKILLRNSDDFFPDIPSSHPWHVFCNAHVSLLTQHLNIVPDWDMFQTSHPYASFHAAARCISGGPIYITDVPGQHDVDLINQMTARTIQGNMVILRPSTLGRALDIYGNYNEGHVLKIGAYNGWAKTGSGIVALFNIIDGEASSIVSLREFPGLPVEGNPEYVVYAHSVGTVVGPRRVRDPGSLISINLQAKGWEILTATPVQSISGFSSHIAVLGLLGKMTGIAAVVDTRSSILDNGRLRIDVSLKALGILGIYISDLDKKTIEDHFMVMISERAVPVHTVQKRAQGEEPTVAAPEILTIDVATAWEEMQLESRWSNEVVIQILIK